MAIGNQAEIASNLVSLNKEIDTLACRLRGADTHPLRNTAGFLLDYMEEIVKIQASLGAQILAYIQSE